MNTGGLFVSRMLTTQVRLSPSHAPPDAEISSRENSRRVNNAVVENRDSNVFAGDAGAEGNDAREGNEVGTAGGQRVGGVADLTVRLLAPERTRGTLMKPAFLLTRTAVLLHWIMPPPFAGQELIPAMALVMAV